MNVTVDLDLVYKVLLLLSQLYVRRGRARFAQALGLTQECPCPACLFLEEAMIELDGAMQEALGLDATVPPSEQRDILKNALSDDLKARLDAAEIANTDNRIAAGEEILH